MLEDIQIIRKVIPENSLHAKIEINSQSIGFVKVGKKVEVFRVTSGPRKTTNALNLLKKALYNVNKQNHLKNRLSCQRCEFFNTQHCTFPSLTFTSYFNMLTLSQ